MIDVTDVPPADAGLGASVTLIGRDGAEQITVDELAGWAGTLSYEILCGISKRVPRICATRRSPGRRPYAMRRPSSAENPPEISPVERRLRAASRVLERADRRSS